MIINSTRNPNIFSKQNQTSSEEIVISDEEDDRLDSSTNTLETESAPVTINDCLLDEYPDLLDDDEDDSSSDEETNHEFESLSDDDTPPTDDAN